MPAGRPRAASRRTAGAADTSAAPPARVRAGEPGARLLTALGVVLVLLVASYRVFDTDFWQHLRIGRVILERGRIPWSHEWTWANLGIPDVNYAWGFDVLLAGVHAALGDAGLTVWKWGIALALFALGRAGARAVGVRDRLVVPLLVLAAVAGRDRLEPRPETIATLLLAASVWVLELRRHGGRDLTGLLPGFALVWVNVHNTVFLLWGLLGVHALAASLARDPAARARARGLWALLAGCVALAFANPWTWRVPWQPFEFAFAGRQRVVFQVINELQPLWRSHQWRELEPVAVALWPLTIAIRALRGRRDPVEIVLAAAFTALALGARRFLGFDVVVMVPYVARALAELAPAPAARPAWAGGIGLAVLSVALTLGTLTRPVPALGIGVIPWMSAPELGDFMQRHHTGRRMFASFDLSGYLVYRGWPDRLPFTDIHQAGTPEDVDDVIAAGWVPEAWRRLDARHHFDQVVVDRRAACDSLLAALEADPRWGLAFADDRAALYLPHGPRWETLLTFEGYPDVPLAPGTHEAWLAGLAGAPEKRARARGQLERMRAASPARAWADLRLAEIADLEGRADDATRLRAEARASRHAMGIE